MDKGSVPNAKVEENAPRHSPSISFNLPIPPSMNSLYGINYRTKQVFLTNDARLWKSRAKLAIPRFICSSSDLLKMTLTFKDNWYFKNGAIRKKDVHNLVKVVVDAVAERCGFDDSQVFSFSCNKVQSDEQTVAVTMGVENETGTAKGTQRQVEEGVGAEV